MDSLLYGNQLSKVSYLKKTFLNLKGFGMIISNRRLRWSQRSTKRMVKRTYLYLVSEIRAEVKDPTRVRERVRSDPHN
jgi:hypothetical protein